MRGVASQFISPCPFDVLLLPCTAGLRPACGVDRDARAGEKAGCGYDDLDGVHVPVSVERSLFGFE